MSNRALLSVEQRDLSLFAVPIDRAEMARHYVLGAEDLKLIRSKRRASNRLGFAVQLCLFRYPGHGLGPGEHPHKLLVAFVAEQLSGAPSAFPNTQPATRPAVNMPSNFRLPLDFNALALQPGTTA